MLGSVGAPDAFADYTSGAKCGHDVCVTVYNSARGSNFIETIYVVDQPNPRLHATYAWTYNGRVGSMANSYGGATFYIHGRFAKGACLSGFVDRVTGSAPCWIVP